MLGPIDYIVVGFQGNNFDGSILGALKKAVEEGVIRVVDLLFIIKDEDGDVVMAEIEDQDDELRELAETLGHEGDMPLLTEDDVAKIGASMGKDTSAGVLIIEQLWAKELKQALLDHDAILIDEGRIHPDTVTAAVEDLELTEHK
jgi:hypothetical protein